MYKYGNEKKVEKERGEKSRLAATGAVSENARVILQEKNWLEQILDHRVKELNGEDAPPLFFSEIPPPTLTDESVYYSELVKELGLGATERLVLIAALMPHIAPDFFSSRLIPQDKIYKPQFPQLGGYVETATKNFIPTLQTVLFLLSGKDMTNNMLYYLSVSGCALLREQVLVRRAPATAEDDTNERNHILTLAPEYVNYILSGEKPRPDFGRAFPATYIKTELSWDDLVLSPRTREQVNEVVNWVKNAAELNRTKKIRIGFPCLFYGPPGTGKTLTAKLMGKYTGRDVFRIDLSMIVSKYIGETEKNLAHLFSRAENKDCILFFDEADSLFSKRTEINSSNDKWANLEVSYLLQKMEDYPGLTILATNLKNNLDAAMTRRFQAMIFFPRPKSEEREQLWKLALPEGFTYEENVSLAKLSKFDLTGANIANIIKFCCTEALAANERTVSISNLRKAIRREYSKESRTI